MTGWTGIVNLYSPGVDTPVATLPVTLDNAGNISFTVPHSITATFNKGDFIYHVVLTDSSGLSRTRILGKIKVIWCLMIFLPSRARKFSQCWKWALPVFQVLRVLPVYQALRVPLVLPDLSDQLGQLDLGYLLAALQDRLYRSKVLRTSIPSGLLLLLAA
jgi:hypothetical protein